MTAGAEIHLHAMCLNEHKIIPYFFRHYTDIVDKFFIYDNGSTDGSLELLQGDERVVVEPFETSPSSFVASARKLLNEVWKRSRGAATWVMIAELDEHLYHQDLGAYLAHCRATGVTMMRAVGYEMVSTAFPEDPRPLYTQVTTGKRSRTLDKIAIFDPTAVIETNFDAGRHRAFPTGKIVAEPFPQVKLLHYKHLGADYVLERNRVLAQGLREEDLQKGWGRHYLQGHDEVKQAVDSLLLVARPVPGLDKTAAFDFSIDEERALIHKSGYFDKSFYLSTYKDVKKDPLTHFCYCGWAEHRKPNAVFDTPWYRQTYGHLFPANVNPLVEYIVAGRNADRMTSLFFDPKLYRAHHRLPRTADVLQHYVKSQRGFRLPRFLASRLQVRRR